MLDEKMEKMLRELTFEKIVEQNFIIHAQLKLGFETENCTEG